MFCSQLHHGGEQTLIFSVFPNHNVHSLCSNPQLKTHLYSVMIGKNKDAIAILYLNFQPVALPNKPNQAWGKASMISCLPTHELFMAFNSEQSSTQFAECQQTFTGNRNQLESCISSNKWTVIICSLKFAILACKASFYHSGFTSSGLHFLPFLCKTTLLKKKIILNRKQCHETGQ